MKVFASALLMAAIASASKRKLYCQVEVGAENDFSIDLKYTSRLADEEGKGAVSKLDGEIFNLLESAAYSARLTDACGSASTIVDGLFVADSDGEVSDDNV